MPSLLLSKPFNQTRLPLEDTDVCMTLACKWLKDRSLKQRPEFKAEAEIKHLEKIARFHADYKYPKFKRSGLRNDLDYFLHYFMRQGHSVSHRTLTPFSVPSLECFFASQVYDRAGSMDYDQSTSGGLLRKKLNKLEGIPEFLGGLINYIFESDGTCSGLVAGEWAGHATAFGLPEDNTLRFFDSNFGEYCYSGNSNDLRGFGAAIDQHLQKYYSKIMLRIRILPLYTC